MHSPDRDHSRLDTSQGIGDYSSSRNYITERGPAIQTQDEISKDILPKQEIFREFRKQFKRCDALEYTSKEYIRAIIESSIFMVLAGTACGLWIYYGDNKKDATNYREQDFICDTPISYWLIIMGISYGFNFIHYLTTLIILLTKKLRSKLTVIILSLFHFYSVVLFQIAWLSYGNIYHYRDNSMRCIYANEDYRVMWILQMISIAFGYGNFAEVGAMFISGCVALIIYIFTKRMPEFVDKIPHVLAIKSLKYLRGQWSIQCAICLSDFKNEEMVTQLNCNDKHYYHSMCIKSWVNKREHCPLCSQLVDSNQI
ncbi:zinc finger protein [Stylonychia lemnae]|uniref:Zinc finger protein n=1 Tax=Stylonychia lemnae TaxID=5949 RepID=A0A078AMX3_STYLE|nr:zinc finger protein [Stylonychia lemnae]|eukprot:CDW82722.1 zinc finger protein [Stylonychia lemnae]